LRASVLILTDTRTRHDSLNG